MAAVEMRGAGNSGEVADGRDVIAEMQAEMDGEPRLDVRPEPLHPARREPKPRQDSRQDARQDARQEPSLAPVGAAPAAPAVLAPTTAAPPVAAPLLDASGGVDALGVAPALDRVAALLGHPRTALPLLVGLLGGPGSGRSFALRGVAERLRALPSSPRLHLVDVDAASLEGDGSNEMALSLAAAVHASLRKPCPELAREAGDAVLDPHAALRALTDRLDDGRRRLDGERRALDEAQGRRARLLETVLFDGAGSQVDGFARANRTAIEGRLAAFGLPGEPVRTFKELVRDAAAPGGRAALVRRSLLGFKGQGRLLGWTAVLVAVAIGLGFAFDAREGWLGELRALPKGGDAAADWLGLHAALLLAARKAAFAGAALLILLWGWRAYGFVAPVLKGVRLLAHDLDGRRRDLDGLVAHQTKRVDALDGEMERLGRAVAQAETRAGGEGRHDGSPFANGPAAAPFFRKLAALMGGQTQEPPGKASPQRLVLLVDDIDALPPGRAAALLDALRRMAQPGMAVVAAFDPSRLRAGTGAEGGSGTASAERAVDVPLRLGTVADRASAGALAAAVLGRRPRTEHEPSGPAIDAPIGDGEAAMLTAVAPLGGSAPRAVRRFLTLYRLARSESERGALALMLALAEGGTSAEREGMMRGLGAGSGGFEPPADASPRLRTAIIAAAVLDGHLNQAALLAAAARASRFGFGPIGLT